MVPTKRRQAGHGWPCMGYEVQGWSAMACGSRWRILTNQVGDISVARQALPVPISSAIRAARWSIHRGFDTPLLDLDDPSIDGGLRISLHRGPIPGVLTHPGFCTSEQAREC